MNLSPHHPADAAVRRQAGLSADGEPLGDGPAREALRQAMEVLSRAEAQATVDAAARCHALTEAARALAGLHAYAAAEAYLAQALRWSALLGGHDLVADLQCAWAEVATNAADLSEARGEPLVCRAARDRAREHAFEAARLASLTTDPNWELRVLLRASDVLDRCGDHDDAVHLQQRALALMGLGAADLPSDDSLANPHSDDVAPLTAPGALM